MDKLTDLINNAKDLEELIPLIDALSRETETMLCRKGLTERDFEIILRPLAKMRSLLSKLDLLLSGPDNTAQAGIIRDLVVRCLDLEGRMKEIRNDRIRPNYAV